MTAGIPDRHRDEALARGDLALVQCAAEWNPDKTPDFDRYLHAALRRRVIDGVRSSLGKSGRKPEHSALHLDDMDWMPVDTDRGPEDVVVTLDETERMWSAVAELDERSRRVLHLRYLEDRRLREIGPTLGVSTSRVNQLELRALRRLRDQLQDA